MLEPIKLSFSAASGALSHILVLRKGEWHTKASKLLAFWLGSVLVLLSYQALLFRSGWGSSLYQSLTYVLVYFSTLLCSLLLYRGLWHPLRDFKGPRAASSSKLWHVFYNRSSQNHLLLDGLHKRYGTFVRTGILRSTCNTEHPTDFSLSGPNELTIYCHEAFEAMDGRGSPCKKSIWHDILLPDVAINSTRVQDDHDRRRRIWLHAFSPKGSCSP